jgi:hypothetical protein
MRVILQTWWQIQRICSGLRYVNCGPGLIQCIYSSACSGSIFSWTYMRCYWWYLDNSTLSMLQTWCQIQRTSVSLLYVNCGSGLIQCNYSFAYSGFNIRLNVSALLLEIIGHFHASYTANLVPNTAHILLFTLCELCSRPYTKSLQLRIFRLQYSAVGNCAVILDIATTQCAL